MQSLVQSHTSSGVGPLKIYHLVSNDYVKNLNDRIIILTREFESKRLKLFAYVPSETR